MKQYSIILLFGLLCLNLFGQDIKPNFNLAKENTFSELIKRYNSKKVSPYWIDSKTFIYVIRQSEKDLNLYKIDCEKQQKTQQKTSFAEVNPSTYRFNYNNKNYLFNVFTGTITDDAKKDGFDQLETDTERALSLFVKSHNLYIKTEKSGEIHQLSNDGENFYSFRADIDYNFTNELLYNDTLATPANIVWSPNSDYFIAFRTDARNLKDNWVINSIAESRPTLTTYKQRNPGDKFPRDEIWIYNVGKEYFLKTNLKKWENENYWFVGWSKYNNGCFVQRINREQNKCDILLLDKDGSYEVIIEEQPDANIYFPQEFRELGKHKYLWFSRRDGWGHLYIYETQKNKTKQLTKGRYTVERVIGIDSASNRIFFTAFGKEENVNPYFRYLYSLNYKTNELTLLTPENANHELHFSPDYKFFVDIYSRVDLPHKSQLRSSTGDLLLDIESANTSGLINSGWKNPEIFKVKAADSITDLWGVMWKPFDFDPNKKYPIITFVYPGPQDNFVPVNFFDRLNNVHLAQYGFIVVMCDSRGSSYKRSKEFSEYYRTNLRDYPLGDNKYMIEQLMKRHSYIDSTKIGIWGGSSGGFMAASAIFQYPDFYKVSVSRAGQHDPKVFHSWWSDIFNTPIGKNESDTLYSNISIANNLKGKLLIIHGEVDMNVHPSNSARLANELIKLGKYFDYLVVPGGGHDWGHNGLYIQKRIWLYFIENLMDYKLEDINIMDY